MKVLVVDDSRLARLVLVRILKRDLKFEDIHEAVDGEDAVTKVTCRKFDLVFLDWNMPKLRGIDALRKIRETDKTTPIIMVTSENERERIAEAVAAGANHYIIKPYTNATVTNTVTKTFESVAERPDHAPTCKALVADDSSVQQKLIAGVLREHCEIEDIELVEDGEEAVVKAANGGFDIILLDWNMPNMDGIDALRKIRETDKRTPILMVTGETDGAKVVEAFDAGANNYIIKPFQPADLAEKIEQVLSLYAG